MNGKQQLMKWVSVWVLVVTALLSTVGGVGAIHLVDPTATGMSSWTRFQQYQAAVENDLAALEALSDGASKGGWERFAEYLWASGVTW